MANMNSAPSSQSNSRRSFALAVLVTVAITAVVGRSIIDQNRIADLARINGDMKDQNFAYALEHHAFLEVLNRSGWEHPFLEGWDRAADTSVSLVQPQDGIYYIIRTTCGACPLNFPALSRIHQSYPFALTVVTLDNDGSDIEDYVTRFAPPTVPLSLVRGGLLAKVPDYSTPILIAIAEGVIVELVTGRIDSVAERRILSTLSTIAPSD